MPPPWSLLGMVSIALAAAAGLAAPAPPVLVAAHRGGALLWPENSLLAFRNALALGVDFVELDVHLTADGEVVVLHDPTLDRTTTGRGQVRAATLAEVRGLRLKTRDGVLTPESVPTLAEVLDLVRPARAGLLLEIKVDADHRRYPEIEEKALALVRSRGLLARAVVMSFDDETLRRVRQLEPGVRTALLVGKGRVENSSLRAPAAIGWARALGATDLGFDYRVIDEQVVAAARKAGLRVGAWTVNEESVIELMIEMGLDVVTTDRPDLALRLRAGKGGR